MKKISPVINMMVVVMTDGKTRDRESSNLQHEEKAISQELNKTKRSCMCYARCSDWSHYDDIMGAWLSSMSMEQKLDLRAAHIACFPVFLTSMGFASVRWSERIINIFEEYSVYHKEQEHCFKSMHTFIKRNLDENKQNIFLS
ncbi:hypothetical protein LSTR_LSTR014433 [Laodelphax striatellus]|uniref:Uncharacterized protein n=1 Tax=Laodelphax striatellus TaxID=195883 RepID=A0A482XAX5_LAOST|nr:hypothetical protein LSTR_LSTR014433 [Laodelphax striatellus]